MVEEEEAPIHTDPRGFLSYKKKTQTMLNHLKNFFIEYPRHPTYLGEPIYYLKYFYFCSYY